MSEECESSLLEAVEAYKELSEVERACSAGLSVGASAGKEARGSKNRAIG